MNKQLLAAVVAVFATYPDAKAVYVCEDGNVFLEAVKNLAENHCRSERLGAPTLVTRDEVEGTAPVDQRTELERRADEETEAARQAIAAEEAAAKEAEEAAAKEAEEAAAKEAEEAKVQEQAQEAAAPVPAPAPAPAPEQAAPKGKKGK